MFNKGTVLLYILVNFLRKAYSKVDFEHDKISDTIFSSQSLLLSTTVLNDNWLMIHFLKEKLKSKWYLACSQTCSTFTW